MHDVRPVRLCKNAWLLQLLAFVTLIILGGCTHATDEPGSELFFRGNDFVRIRLNANAIESETILITENGVVVRAPFPVDQHRTSWLELSTTKFQQMQALRKAWCTTPPVFPTPTNPATNYDVAMRCTYTFKGTQFSVPPESLPSILRWINQQVPPLRSR